jgi:hypothetical protein
LVGALFCISSCGVPGCGHLVDINGGKGQQADQQEIANDDEDASVHAGVAVMAASSAAFRRACASDCMSNWRRTGRRLKILKTKRK